MRGEWEGSVLSALYVNEVNGGGGRKEGRAEIIGLNYPIFVVGNEAVVHIAIVGTGYWPLDQ